MRNIVALSAFVAVLVPAAASAQDVIIRERSERVIVQEPSERVIVQEPSERRVIVRERDDEETVTVRRAPSTVRRYVVEERRPSVQYERRIVIGDTLPESVEAYDVPDSDYRYSVVNGERYILDRDRRIVEVAE